MQTALRSVLRVTTSRSPSLISSANHSRSTPQRLMASAAGVPGAVSYNQQHKYLILQYNYVPDILERRGPFRAEHVSGIKAQSGLVFAGAFNPSVGSEAVTGGLLIWKDTSPEDIEAFVKADPYVVNGLVASYDIKPYNVVTEPK